MTFTPTGKGIWINHWGEIAPTYSEAAQSCKDWGIGTVYIKSGDGSHSWPDNCNAAIVAEFTSRGIAVFAWHYVYPSNPVGDSAAVVAESQIAGLTGMVLDAEVEFEPGHTVEPAREICRAVKEGAPDGLLLGYTSFALPEDHEEFPYHVFDFGLGDFFLPQVYSYVFSGRLHDNDIALAECAAQCRKIGLQSPIWPIQTNGDDSDFGASVEYMNDFFRLADVFKGLTPGTASLWRWPDSKQKEAIARLSLLHWRNAVFHDGQKTSEV